MHMYASAAARAPVEPTRLAQAIGEPTRIVDRPIGYYLQQVCGFSDEQLEEILALQRQRGIRFGQAAVALKLATGDDVIWALSQQFHYPNTLRDRLGVSELVVATQPFGPEAEAFRELRSQLLMGVLNGDRHRRRALAVISTDRGDGKSYVAANLAVAFGQLAGRTLLIDADMRNPRQHELFMLQNKSGLSTLLAHRSREEAIVRITDLVGLSVLPAGPVPPNPSELLNRPAFEELLQHARSSYDVVLIDTPSLSSGDDAAMIAVRAGAVVALARSRETRLSAFNDIVAGLSSAGVAVVGSVLNDVPVGKRARK